MHLDPGMLVTLAISITVLGVGRLIDWLIARTKARNAAVAAGRGPLIPTSWQEAYEDLMEKFLRLEAELADVRDQLTARDQAIRKQPYEIAQTIYSDTADFYSKLRIRRPTQQ